MSDWILCSERLPDYGNMVLVTVYREGKFLFGNDGFINRSFSYTDVVAYVGDRWKGDNERSVYFMDEVIAWQPLPKPYREKELGPCPVCGSERVYIARAYTHENGASWYRLECESCCRERGPFYSDKESAIKAWNRRASDD